MQFFGALYKIFLSVGGEGGAINAPVVFNFWSVLRLTDYTFLEEKCYQSADANWTPYKWKEAIWLGRHMRLHPDGKQ